jgi:hypothetical protein
MTGEKEALTKEVEKRGWFLTHFEEGKAVIAEQAAVGRTVEQFGTSILREPNFVARLLGTSAEIGAASPDALVDAIDAHPLTEGEKSA